jgi:hypothetical protein
MKELKVCIVCSNDFKPRKESQKFCSKKCVSKNKSLNSQITKNCIFCELPFTTPKHLEKEHCSSICAHSHRSEKTKEIRNCLNCDTSFKVKKISKTIYCSQKCCGEHHIKTKRRVKKDNKKVDKNCLNCNKEYKVWKYRETTSKFCSQKCSFEFKNILSSCIKCGVDYNIPQWEKDSPINALCIKCRVNSPLKRPLRKSSFELNVIYLLKEKLKDRNILIDNKIKLENTTIFPDIVIDNNIIECNGDYWHCNPNKFDKEYYHKHIHKKAFEIWEKDQIKKEELEKQGYNVLIIWEEDFFTNKEECINNLIKNIK